jgi:hypothetical protein
MGINLYLLDAFCILSRNLEPGATNTNRGRVQADSLERSREIPLATLRGPGIPKVTRDVAIPRKRQQEMKGRLP